MSYETMDAEARALVETAEQAGLPLRAIGGVAVWQRLGDAKRSRFQEVRPVPRDLDLLAPSNTSSQISEVFRVQGYEGDERLIAWHGNKRHRYFRLDDGGGLALEVDVFLGDPPLCHAIDFRDRLSVPGPAMSVTDLLLQKLQIVDSNPKDLIDLSFLLLDHNLEEDEPDGIDVRRVAELLGRDWGFYYTTSQNLDKAEAAVGDFLTPEQSATAKGRIARLKETIEAAPKTRRWKLREKVGTRVQWYTDVEEVER